jgi:transcription initiation protein SPT3
LPFLAREEYQRYSECRQASFTYRKGINIYDVGFALATDIFLAKRLRELLNLPPHLDLKANDDTVDIIGFLAFEMVRSLTLAGLAVKKSLEICPFSPFSRISCRYHFRVIR